jgi:pimeloyl-ACP methyl ester carboxylesterase
MNIYRSESARQALTDWCRRRLDGWEVEHTRDVLDTALGETHVVVAGQVEPTVVILPGTNFNAATSTTIAGRFAARHRTVVVDLPGQPGLSAAERPQADRLRRYGSWLDELLPSLAHGQVVLVGHSLGAAVALSATPSDRIAGLVLLDPAGLVRARLTGQLLTSTLQWIMRPNPRNSERLLRYMSAPGHAPSRELVDWMTIIVRCAHTSVAPGPMPVGLVRRWLSTPRVVATGEYDRFFSPEHLRGPVRDRLGSETVVLAGSGHLAPEENPEDVVTLLSGLARNRD